MWAVDKALATRGVPARLLAAGPPRLSSAGESANRSRRSVAPSRAAWAVSSVPFT